MDNYGSPCAQRAQGWVHVPDYFNVYEARWRDLVNGYGSNLVPFEAFFHWCLGKKVVGYDHNGRPRFTHFQNILLLGKLAAYLLTADLTYTGKVSFPTVVEVARVVHHNRLGLLQGLYLAHQTSQKRALEQEVVEAFTRVYDYLLSNLDEHDRQLMVFDPIMVEHLLCKFHCTKYIRAKLG